MSTNLQEPDPLRIEADDHALGNPAAAIVLVEYGDYQCPLCTQVHPVVQALVEGMRHQMRFVWRHFPLLQAHPDALGAALAVEAADLQGLFWPMHDRVARHQLGLDAAALAIYAAAVGADVARFAREAATPSADQRVRRDMASGERLDVRATPTFFLNGERFDISFGIDRLQQELLKMAHAGAPAGDLPR